MLEKSASELLLSSIIISAALPLAAIARARHICAVRGLCYGGGLQIALDRR
jgi:enoyl-CoA hydratase/carnithine racemase